MTRGMICKKCGGSIESNHEIIEKIGGRTGRLSYGYSVHIDIVRQGWNDEPKDPPESATPCIECIVLSLRCLANYLEKY